MTTAYYPPTFRRQRIKVLRRKIVRVGRVKGLKHPHTLMLKRKWKELILEAQREEEINIAGNTQDDCLC